MYSSDISRLLPATLLAALICVAAGRPAAAAPNIRFSAGYSFDYVKLIKFTESGGVKPQYNDYRMKSLRHLLNGTLHLGDLLNATLSIGQADLETHSDEGETTEFDPVTAYGFGLESVLPVPAFKNISLALRGSYFHYEPDDEHTTEVAKHSRNSGGDLSIDWTEWRVSACAVYEAAGTPRVYAGVEYRDISADQDRVFSDHTVSSSFDQEDEVGLLTGLSCRLADHVQANLDVRLIHETSFRLGLTYSF